MEHFSERLSCKNCVWYNNHNWCEAKLKYTTKDRGKTCNSRITYYQLLNNTKEE